MEAVTDLMAYLILGTGFTACLVHGMAASVVFVGDSGDASHIAREPSNVISQSKGQLDPHAPGG